MSKKTKPQLARVRRILRRHLPEMQTRYHVKSLRLFVSFVRGEQRKRSDLDVLVAFGDPNLSLIKFIEIENYLTDLLGVKVDLVEKSGLKPRIGEQILKRVVPL